MRRELEGGMDRTLKGFIAGIGASLVVNAIQLPAYYWFHIIKIRFLDWAAILVMRGLPQNTAETIFALVQQLLWDGLLGSIFALMLPHISSKGYPIKGAIYGALLAFIFCSIAIMFRLPFLTEKVPLGTVLFNELCVLLWGIILAVILKKLEL